MKILITGGSGFIGTYLTADLLAEGHDVVIYDKQPSTRYPDCVVQADVRNQAALSEALQGVDRVYHLAAEHRDDVRPESLYHEVNVGGAENLAAACEAHHIDHLMFTSTVAVYGLNAGVPNEDSRLAPFNAYGRSKQQAEQVLTRWAAADRQRHLTIVRPTVIFGETNRGNVYNLLRQIASGRFLMVGRGQNRKSMGYVRNLSRFLVTTARGAPGVHIFNYADQPDFSMAELVAVVRQTLSNGRRPLPRIPYTVGLAGGMLFDLLSRLTGCTYPISAIRIKKFCADTRISVDKLAHTGFAAPYSLTEALQRTIQAEFK